jgi:hypothetical protein
MLNDKFGFINEKFEESEIKYDYVSDFENGFAIVMLNDKFGFINEKFEESEIKYDYALNFENGFAIVKLNDKCGFINEEFEESEIKYDDVWNFENGFARVKLNEKWGFMNEKFEAHEIKEIYGYKATDENMECRDFQYKLNEKYTIENIEICKKGFHFCYDLKNCFEYYPNNKKNRFFKVKIIVDKLELDFSDKLCSNNIEFIEEVKDLENFENYKGRIIT